MDADNPLARLIRTRSQELGLTVEALGIRLGYQNSAKGAGRVKALCDGQINSPKSRFALDRLAAALELPPQTVEAATRATEAILAEEEEQHRQQRLAVLEASEAVWRANFRCHAILLTANTRPTSIVFCGLSGGPERWLHIKLNTNRPPITFARQVLDILPSRLERMAGGGLGVRFFGCAVGFAINYDPDHSIRFDLDGTPLEVLQCAYRTGVTEIHVGGRKMTPEAVTAIMRDQC